MVRVKHTKHRYHRINFDWVFGFHTKSPNQFHHITIAILTNKIISRAKHTKHRYQSQAKKGSKQTSVSARLRLGSPAKRKMTWQQDIGSKRLSYLLFCNSVRIKIFSAMPYMQNQQECKRLGQQTQYEDSNYDSKHITSQKIKFTNI